MRLKIIAMNTDGITERYCELEEAKTWDYSDPGTMIGVSGIQVMSWEELLEIVSRPAVKDSEEIEIYIMPPIAGG